MFIDTAPISRRVLICTRLPISQRLGFERRDLAGAPPRMWYSAFVNPQWLHGPIRVTLKTTGGCELKRSPLRGARMAAQRHPPEPLSRLWRGACALYTVVDNLQLSGYLKEFPTTGTVGSRSFALRPDILPH